MNRKLYFLSLPLVSNRLLHLFAGTILFILTSSSEALAGENDSFTVTKIIPGCKYFIIETPAWEVVAEEWTCSKPSEGDTGTGDLIGYFARHVKLNGSSCDLWVETWGGSSTVNDRISSKCGIK